jgi:hypothetical protein
MMRTTMTHFCFFQLGSRDRRRGRFTKDRILNGRSSRRYPLTVRGSTGYAVCENSATPQTQSNIRVDELVVLIRSIAKQSPSWKARIGTIDTSKGKTWIEIKFPDGPPLEYERPGVELTEDMEWRKTTRPVEVVHHQRLNKVLFPTEVSTALYHDTKHKVQLSWQAFRAYLGLSQTSESETVQSVIQQAFSKSPSPSSPGVASNPAATSPSASAAPDSKEATDAASTLSSQVKELGFALPDPKKLTLDLTNFRKDFRKYAKPSGLSLPRGSFIVLGMVEVYGDRARITLNVVAAYDPKQGRYVSLTAGIWNIVPHGQSPKGGP